MCGGRLQREALQYCLESCEEDGTTVQITGHNVRISLKLTFIGKKIVIHFKMLLAVLDCRIATSTRKNIHIPDLTG